MDKSYTERVKQDLLSEKNKTIAFWYKLTKATLKNHTRKETILIMSELSEFILSNIDNPLNRQEDNDLSIILAQSLFHLWCTIDSSEKNKTAAKLFCCS